MTLPTTGAPHESLFLPERHAAVNANRPARTPSSRIPEPAKTPSDPASEAWESSVAPAMPTTVAETGLSSENILALSLKALYGGELSGLELSDEVKISYSILEGILEAARVQQLIEVRSATGAGTAGYRYTLTDRGRDRTNQFFETNGYIGAAPVPLDQYVRYVTELGKHNSVIDREVIASGFTDLIVSDDMLDQLGPAVSTRRAMFLYGPPGNGKSAMSAGIGRALGGAIYMPYALDIGGQIVTLFDPVTHVPQPVDEGNPLFRSDTASDPRWVRIRRPVITVGGELTMEQLDLSFDPFAKFYEAPVQLKANCGVLLVDDFGRQRVPASDLLNRWIVPLESRIDFLALHTGRKFEVPFDVLVIFATNLEPRTLADEAFLRRIPYKIHATDPSLEQFSAIFYMVCKNHGITFDQTVVDHLCEEYYEGRGLDMRACHPRDLIEHMVNLCRYRKQPLGITTKLLDEACRTYFLDKPLHGTEAAV
jgi:hypothetical protein